MTDTPLLGRSDAVPRRRWRWLLPFVVVVALVALVGSLVARAAEQGRLEREGRARRLPRRAVQHGDTNAAYGMLCASSSTPAKAEFDAAGGARSARTSAASSRHRMGTSKHVADGDETVSYTDPVPQHLSVVRGRASTRKTGDWKVCGFKEIPRPEVRVPYDPLEPPPPDLDTGTTTSTN